MTLSSLSNFITTRLGRMKAWASCNSLDWVTCYPLHFTHAYIVYRESQTCQVVYIHVHYGVHGEIYIGLDSRLIDLSLCCIICSQIKKIRVLVAKPELLISSCHPNERQSAVFPPRATETAPCGLRIAQMSAQFSWSWLSVLMKNRGVGWSCKISAVLTVLSTSYQLYQNELRISSFYKYDHT